MLLLCTIATVMLSMAGLSILHSHTRNLARTRSVEASTQSRLAAEGLMQRAVARIALDPAVRLTMTDPNSTLPNAFADIVPISADQSQVRIYLYQDSKIPALTRVINTAINTEN